MAAKLVSQHSIEVTDTASEVGQLIIDSAPELGRSITPRVHGLMPEFGADSTPTSLSIATVQAIISGFGRALMRHDEMETFEAPTESLELSRAFVRRGYDVRLLLRQYRLGHAELWRIFEEVLADQDLDQDLMFDVQRFGRELLFRYMDDLTEGVLAEFMAERDRWQQSAVALRAQTVEELIEGNCADSNKASAILQYRLDRDHLGVIAYCEETAGSRSDGAQASLENALERLGAAAGAGSQLLIPAGRNVMFAWLGFHTAPDVSSIEIDRKALREDGIALAIGGPAGGMDGFRLAHLDAQATRRLALVCGDGPGSVGIWSNVAVLGLLATDADRARRFVTDELGELDAENETMARLRATLAVYFRENNNVARTAETIGIHANTVAYRLRQCEETLGRSIRERRFELEAALRLRNRAGTRLQNVQQG